MGKVMSTERKHRNLLYISIGLLVVVAIGYFLWFVVMNGQSMSRDSADWGAFGDFFNPFITLATLLWVVRTVIIQQEELSAAVSSLDSSYRAQEKSSYIQRDSARINAITARVNAIQSDIDEYQYERRSLAEKVEESSKKSGHDAAVEHRKYKEDLEKVEKKISELRCMRNDVLDNLPDLHETISERMEREIERAVNVTY